MSFGEKILIVGLGNFGKQYDKTRHNAGFAVIDEIMHKYRFSSEKDKFEALIADVNFDEKKLISAKPQTFMNNSGIAVQKITSFYKIPVEDVIVFHDDIDLEVGDIRVKRGGGHAGHNGLRSLDSHVGKNYLRVRIGVGRPADRDDVSNFVLSRFSKEEQIILDEISYDLSANLPLILEDKIDEFLAKIK